MSKLIFFISACLLLNFTNLFAQDKPEWSVNFSKNISWHYLTTSGIMLVCNSEALFGIDPQKKDTAWSLPAYKGLPIERIKSFQSHLT